MIIGVHKNIGLAKKFVQISPADVTESMNFMANSVPSLW